MILCREDEEELVRSVGDTTMRGNNEHIFIKI